MTDLRTYWAIARRRWWLPLAMAAVAAVLTLATSNFAPGGYTAGLRMLIEVPSDPPTVPFYRYDKYYSLLSSEFVVDDYIEVVRSAVFLEDVKRETNLPNAGIGISSQPRSERAPRVMTVTVSGTGREEVQRAANAVVDLIVNRSSDYMPALGNSGVVAKLIDPPNAVPASPGSRIVINVALRALLGLAAGLALLFLWHYLEGTLYDRSDVRRLGLPLLGELPRFDGPYVG